VTDIDPALAERYASVMQGVADACRSAERSVDEITTIVVTKFHPASVIEQLAALGVTDVGENRHQDAAPKAAALAALPLTWHFVGQLQSNKARAVTEYARVIHSIDRPSLVTALRRVDREIDVFIEVNLTHDEGRGGAEPGEVLGLAESVLDVPALRLRGVMAVAPLDEPARAAFARLRSISDEVRALSPEARSISAGMSGDYADAIAEGATHLRIGAAITGKRPAQP
jgi:pyridoxal phosphate enzyme (YggS family)